jgi:hypothetical protein
MEFVKKFAVIGCIPTGPCWAPELETFDTQEQAKDRFAELKSQEGKRPIPKLFPMYIAEVWVPAKDGEGAA